MPIRIDDEQLQILDVAPGSALPEPRDGRSRRTPPPRTRVLAEDRRLPALVLAPRLHDAIWHSDRPGTANRGGLFQEYIARAVERLGVRLGRDETIKAIRQVVERIEMTPTEDGQLAIRVKANVAGVLAAAGVELPSSYVGCGGSQPTVPPALYVVAA